MPYILVYKLKWDKGDDNLADWKKMKTEYLTSDTSYRKLADKFNVKFSTLKNVAVREGWAEQKRTKEEKKDKLIAKKLEKMVSEEVDCIAETYMYVDKADKLLEMMFEQYLSEGQTKSANELKTLYDCIDKSVNLKRSIKKIPNLSDDYTREKLDIEKKKIEDTEIKDIKVEMEDILDEYGE